jgi:hypothetical protein
MAELPDLKNVRPAVLIVVFVAVAGLSFVAAMSGLRATDMLPARVLRAVISSDTRTAFFDHIRTFANFNDFELSDTSDPDFPIGPIYSIYLNRKDIRIFIANVTKDTGPIDPNGHTGAPPVTMDPSDYRIVFYNNADTSGHTPGPVDDMVNTFKNAMSDIKGIRIETNK